MTAIIGSSQTLTALTCWVCGIHFAMPEVLERKRAEDGKPFHCPNGDKISYGPSLLEQAERKLRAAQAAEVHQRDQRIAAERAATAYKGHVTRLKTRSAAGVCPCCTRSFENLRRHMTSKHPDYAAEAAS
jgi:hypothetical protein